MADLTNPKIIKLKGINSLPLFAGFAGLGVLLLAFASMWWREGR